MNYLTKMSVINGRMVVRSQEFLAVSSQLINNSRHSSDDIRFLSKTEPANLKRGRGGRSSFSGVVATVFGATGFIGKVLCNRLSKCGTQMIIPYRGEKYDTMRLKLMGDLGQIMFLPYHLCDEAAIRKAVKYSNVVINLVGREWETPNFSFHQVHVEGARRIARISKEMGVQKFVQLSALNSNIDHKGYVNRGGSKFLKTKKESEDAVKEFYPDAIIFRPADVWGQQDRFLWYYARYFRYQGNALPLPFKGNDVWKQPVFCSDLAQGIVNAIYDHQSLGITYEAVGPRRYELGELTDYFNRVMRRDDDWGYYRYDMKWDPTSVLKARLNEKLFTKAPFLAYTTDKIEREAISDTTFDLPNLEDLGVTLTILEDRIVWELKPFKHHGYYLETLGEFPAPALPKFVVP